MPLSFPSSPTTGQTYTVGGRTWTWSGSVWELNANTTGVAAVGTGNIADGAVTTEKIANGAVVEADIAANAVTAGKLGTDVQLGYRNVVINGAMQVAQRGTSTTGITLGALYYTADRMMFYVNSAGTWTQDIQNDAPTGSGFRKSFRALCTTADASLGASDELIFIHRIEGQNLQQFLKGTSSAKQFTLSFWVKSNATGTYNVEFRDEDNARHIVGSYTINASGTWEKKTITVAGDTTAAFDNDNGMSLQMQFWLAAGSNYTSGTRPSAWASSTNANRAVGQTNLAAATNNYWQITGVQLEAGAVATPFEFEDYGVTLAKCQRYYHEQNTTYVYYNIFNSGNLASSVVQFPVAMRAAPTITVFDAASTSGRITIANAGGSTQNNITPPSSIDVNSSCWQYVAGGITGTTGNNGMIHLSKYTANGEL